MLLFHYFLVGYAFLLIFFYAIFGLATDMTPISYVFVLMANIYMMICSRRNFLLFIVAFILFFSNYSIIYANFAGTIDNVFTSHISEESFVISLNVLTLINVFVCLFVRWERISRGFVNNVFVDYERNDPLILVLLSFMLIPIFFLGFTVPEVEGERGSPSAAYEYASILFILFFYYSGNKKWYIRSGLALVGIYSLQSFIFGGRIEAIQFILVTFIMLFMHKISMPKVMVAMGAMFILMSIIGQVRGELLAGNADVASILSSLAESGFALDTAYSAYYTSESFIFIIDKFTSVEILLFFWEFIKSIFVGSNPDILLSSLSKNYVFHYGGGVLPFYFYFYLGILGIFIIGILVSFYLNKVIALSSMSSGYMKCLSVWVVSTTFRWYLYTPLPLLRGVLFMTIAYYSFAYLHYQLDRLPLKRNFQN